MDHKSSSAMGFCLNLGVIMETNKNFKVCLNKVSVHIHKMCPNLQCHIRINTSVTRSMLVLLSHCHDC